MMALDRDRYLVPALVILAVAVLFTGLSATGLKGDEVNYAAIAKRMLERHDWMTLYYFRDWQVDHLRPYMDPETGMAPFWEKTPLGIWLLGLALAVTGPGEFSMRLPAALLSVGIVGLTYAITRLLTASAWAAFLAGIVLLTSAPFLVIAQINTLDAACIFFMVLAAYVHLLALRRDHRLAALVGPALGLAFLAKPFVPLLVLPALVIHVALRRRLVVLSPYLAAGLLIGVLLNAPWFVYEYARFGSAFTREFFQFTVSTGVSEAGRGYPDDFFYRNHALYYVRHLFVLYLPWVLLVPAAVVHCLRREHDLDLKILPLLWVLVVFGVFTLSQTRFPHYIAPMYPMLAILLGVYLFRLGRATALGRWSLVAILAMVAVRTGYLAYAAVAPVPPTMPFGLRWGVGLTVALLLTTLFTVRPGRTGLRAVLAAVAGIYLVNLGVMASYAVYVAHVDQKTARDYIVNVRPEARVVGVAERDLSRASNGLYWYFGKVPFATESDGLKRLVRESPGPAFVITDPWGARVIAADFPASVMRFQFLDVRFLSIFEVTTRQAAGSPAGP